MSSMMDAAVLAAPWPARAIDLAFSVAPKVACNIHQRAPWSPQDGDLAQNADHRSTVRGVLNQPVASLILPIAAVAVAAQRRSRNKRSCQARAARCQRAAAGTETSSPRVAVIGAGPAGLSTALALRKITGLTDVTVFERSSELRPNVGGGLQLHGGAALLEELGVPLRSVANPLRGIRSRGASDGELFFTLDLPSLVDQFEAFTGSLKLPDGELASCTVMRDALQELIAAQLPQESLQFGKTLSSVEATSNEQVSCKFGADIESEFDLVVVADGINSVGRSAVVDDGTEAPRYTGIRIQYGVREAGGRPEGLPYEQEAHQWFADGTYALTATYGGRAGKQYEMIAVVFRDDKEAAENSNWEANEVRDECLSRLKASGQSPEVLKVAEGCDRFFELGVCDRPVGLSQWHSGRVVLVGDSAHGMPPFLGQGANQAVQDAVCLARWLKTANFASGSAPDAFVQAALFGYTAQRIVPCAVLGIESNFLGQVETLPGSLGVAVRDNFFKVAGGSGVAGLVFLNGAIVRA